MKAVLSLAVLLIFSFQVQASVGIPRPVKGTPDLDSNYGVRPPREGSGNYGPGIGRFERKEQAKALVADSIKNSALDLTMKEQPNDLSNVAAALVKAVLADVEIRQTVQEIAESPLPRNPEALEKLRFNMQMALTTIAAQYGYEEQDN